MSTICSVYIAASLDGYIAGPDGDISWLENPEYSSAPTPGLSYDEFISTIDAIVMGRNTFEKVLTFGFWPYEETDVFVLTGRELTLPEELAGKVFHESGQPDEVVARLSKEGKKHLYIDGGLTIQQFLKAGLIDEMTITFIPVLLGRGISLFGETGKEIQLQLIEADSASNGFVQVRYSINR